VWWLAQWNLAQKYDLPLIIHTRDARDVTLKFMKENNINRCVMHCFSEDWDFARELLESSDEIYFSFSGIVTYKNAQKIQEAAKKIPLNRILVETDSPFLPPQIVR
jgi:TatD DNase family protein